MRFKERNCAWPQVLLGLISLCLGVTNLLLLEYITNEILDYFLFLKPSSYSFEEWANTTAGIDVEIYFFNWTNPNDFKNRSVKPKFNEVGPYYFHEKYKKVDIVFNDNFTVSYRVNKTFYFDEKKSKRSLDEAVTSLNPIAVVASDKARNWNYVLRKFLSISLNVVPYESTKTIKELLFDGYEDTLLTTAGYLPFLDDIPDVDRFAWFLRRNGSTDYEGTFTMGTGLGNSTLGKLYKWNYNDKGPYPGQCSDINVPMEWFPRMKKDNLEVFNPDFCRKVTLEFNETVTFEGMEGYKFTAGNLFLDSGTINPENKCICSKKCQRFGVVDYSKCKYGLPVFLSFPHFHMADPGFRNELEGLKSDHEKYESYIIINSRTGVILEMKIAIQLNLFVEPNPLIRKFNDVPEIMVPVFWFSVVLRQSDSIKTELKLLNLVPVFLKIFSTISLIFGAVILIFSVHRRIIQTKPERNKGNRNILLESKPLNSD